MFNSPPLIKLKDRDKLNERLERASEHVLAHHATTVEVPSRRAVSNVSACNNSVKGETVASSRKSSSARRKQLELEAARARAKIEIQLINKQLEADIALMEEGDAMSLEHSSQRSHNVEKWLQHSHAAQSSQVPLEEPAAAIAAPTMAPKAPQPAPISSRQLPASALPVDSIFELAQALKDVMVASPSKEDRLLTRLATPRELPAFTGDCIEWLHFKNAYDESTRVCHFTDFENLWRLRRALKGDAREAVTDLLIGNTSPDTIMKTLELRFGQSDLIIEHLTHRIRKLPALPMSYHNDLITFSTKVNSCVSTLRALNKQDYLRSPELASAVVSKLPSVLVAKWIEYAFPKLQDGLSKLELLSSFLQREAEMISVVGVANRKPEHDKPATTYPKKVDKPRASVFATTFMADNKCKFCKKSFHLLNDCRLFKRAMRKERWKFVKTNNLCFGCLAEKKANHSCSTPPCDIDNCGLAHNKLLHFKLPTNSSLSQAAEGRHRPADESPTSNATVALVARSRGEQRQRREAAGLAATDAEPKLEVMLKVVKVQLCGANGVVSAYALLDDGASISMIDADLVKELGINSLDAEPVKLIDAFGLEVFQSNTPRLRTKISAYGNVNYHDVTLRQVDKLKLPMQHLSVINRLQCKHLLNVKEYVCKENVVPRLLIGEDNYFLLAPLAILHGGNNEPYATKCRLGWSIHGCYGRTHNPVSGHVLYLDRAAKQVSCDVDVNNLNELIKQSFELDSIGISTLRRDNKAHSRAVDILDSTARCIGQRWEVGLPFKQDNFTLPDSYEYARSRLRGLMRKFEADSAYADRYRNEIGRLFECGYARELADSQITASNSWYLSHFGVQNPNKPGKLRLVFDCAGRVNDVCLNDFLLTGPDLYNSLLGIMLRFREHTFVIIGDIKEMFLQIKIRPEDQHVLRFLWQTSLDAPMKICTMQSLIFGATCSPFIAQYIKNKNALKYQDLYPEAVDVIVNNHYMDDCLHSCASETQASQLVRDITMIHKQGGFEITRWSSNSKAVLRTIPPDALAHTAMEFKHGSNNTMERTLGLMWYPSDDTFGFKISLSRVPKDILDGIEPPTKAKMLSIIMSVYDLHGFLSPFIIKGKIIFQNVHRSGIDWDCRIHPADHTAWVSWLNDLKRLDKLRIPRCYTDAAAWTPCYEPNESSDNDCTILEKQMHIFCDASLKSYAAVIYWRFTRSDGFVQVCFVVSKSRVSPLRPISIPRLELQGALLGARLAKSIESEHRDIKPTKRYFWSDSSTVLQWIRSDPRVYKPYVAHRLGEIDELTKSCDWRYVPSGLNSADIATREDSPPLTYSDAWFQGPSFLRLPEEEWPKDRKFTKLAEDVKCEERSVHTVATVIRSELSLPDENNTSSWMTLVRATARVLLFTRRCQRKNVQLDVALMREAEDLLIKKSQRDTFSSELSCLKHNKPLPSNSRLLQLTPYLDVSGILRVGGRIDKVTGVERATLRPAILDGKHRICHLLIEYHHVKALHGANEYVVNQLRQQYWILRLRPTVRTISSRCLFCRRRRAMPQPQRMADLPAARLQHNRRPFTYSGVDFFSPMEVTVGRKRLKRYGMLFTCLTIRAIHIEMTEDLTTDSAILGLRKMGARRGFPSVLYSDNGRNLRGADNELKRSLQELNNDTLQEDGAIRGVEWRFIPPGAPEMGGAWERLVRTVKTALKVILKERAPHPDTLMTLLAEVEALVNSRPITHVSTDPNYPEALTPNHFLIGTSSNGPVFGKYDDTDLCLRKRWRVAQRLTDMFWHRWIREYLPTLLPRQKWTKESRSLQVGDYVAIVEPNLDRGCWKHGVVSATYPGVDGRVRIVDVRTRTGTLRRPVTRVALISEKE